MPGPRQSLYDSPSKTPPNDFWSFFLCVGSEAKVVRTLVQAKTVPHLVGLLQLNQPELQTNVARVLAMVADASEQGLADIVKNGGIVPLVTLLADKNVVVKE